jgi:hypothetical protein
MMFQAVPCEYPGSGSVSEIKLIYKPASANRRQPLQSTTNAVSDVDSSARFLDYLDGFYSTVQRSRAIQCRYAGMCLEA